MEFHNCNLEGVVLITPRVFEDERGFFMESYSARIFAEHGIDVRFVQDNHSRSTRGVLRGLHFQKNPHAQDKLVRIIRGEVLDVVVDLRVGSPTYRRWIGVPLSETNKNILFIPKGCAHGFVTRSEIAELEYKVSDFYDAACDGGIAWNDPEIAVDWEIEHPILSQKDAVLPTLKEIGDLFTYGT
jgi:dTDP-4-dehydrorhamnose 3,5-epimerase